MRVVIAEDDEALGSFLKHALAGDAGQVELAQDGESALSLVFADEPDLLILDLDLPIRSGFEVLDAVRSTPMSYPILILSGGADTATRVRCLEGGADDCLLKPFSLSEFRARARVLLRRRHALRDRLAECRAEARLEQMQGLSFANVHLHRLTRLVTVDSHPVRLTNREYALLEQLMLAGASILPRQALRLAVWEQPLLETNALDVHLAALRRKLQVAGAAVAVETVRGQGFRLALRAPLAAQLLPALAREEALHRAALAQGSHAFAGRGST